MAVLTSALSQFQYIYDHSTREYPAIGTLTTQNRDVWAKVRTLQHPLFELSGVCCEFRISHVYPPFPGTKLSFARFIHQRLLCL